MSKQLSSRTGSYRGSHDATTRSTAGVVPIEPSHPAARRRSGSLLSRVMLIGGILLLVIALAGLGNIWLQYKQGRDLYAAVQRTGGVTSDDVVGAAQGDTGTLDVDWASLAAQNGDIVGWVAVPGLDDVSYPVVQASDNTTYLRTGFDGNYSINGCIFMDEASAADLSDPHTVIYGHHMNDGSMFAQLAGYTDATFFSEHPVILYATAEKTYHLTVIAAYAAQENEDMRTTSFASQQEWTAYVQDILDKATVTDGKTVASQITHLYSFITCSYAQKDDRTVVVAIEAPA